MKTILVVDDERNIIELVRLYLEQAGFAVVEARDGQEALDQHDRVDPDLVVLDLMMPKVDGMEVTREIRRRGETPILMLTARSEDIDRIVGLELGADDYLTKPFDFPELEARMRALLRRSRPASDATHLQLGNLKLDREARRATVRGEALDLSPREWLLLELLLTHRDKVATKEQIAQAWGTDRSESGGPGSTEVYIHRLRRKIEDSGLVIRTVRGLGYLLETEAG